jgi:hypothetical protein
MKEKRIAVATATAVPTVKKARVPSVVEAVNDEGLGLFQVSLANTRLELDQELEKMRSDFRREINGLSDELSAKTAQISDLNERVKQLAKKGAKYCAVCFVKENDHAFIPCGHKCMCLGCAELTMNKFKTCPYCRTKITSIQRIYSASSWDSETPEKPEKPALKK